ncbi:MAG: glutaminyl-peptide cyclotransferase [Myxococcota bacterium]
MSDDNPGPTLSAARLLLAAGLVALVALALWARGAGEAQETVEAVELPPQPAPDRAASAGPEQLRVRVVRRLPHARDAFTQGLLWHAGKLYESTGQYGQSSLRRVDLMTGDVELRTDLDDAVFAEGLARVGERFVQLSWRSGRAFVWRETDAGFERLTEHEYAGEGWGLCFDGRRLVMSDGSATLTFRDPETFEEQGHVLVTDDGRPVRNLNELECVTHGDETFVLANVWQREFLVRIDPASGRVTARIDARGLLRGRERYGTDVINGIAWLPERESYLLTGKYWPAAFEVVLEPSEAP